MYLIHLKHSNLIRLNVHFLHSHRLVWSSRSNANSSNNTECRKIFLHLFSSSKTLVGKEVLKALLNLMVINSSDASPVWDHWEKNGRFRFLPQEEGNEGGRSVHSETSSNECAEIHESRRRYKSDKVVHSSSIMHGEEDGGNLVTAQITPSPSSCTSVTAKRSNPTALVRDGSDSEYLTHQSLPRHWTKIACPPLSIIIKHSTELAKTLKVRAMDFLLSSF